MEKYTRQIWFALSLCLVATTGFVLVHTQSAYHALQESGQLQYLTPEAMVGIVAEFMLTMLIGYILCGAGLISLIAAGISLLFRKH